MHFIDKQKFFEFVSDINDANKLVSYSEELDENIFIPIVKKLLNSSSNFVYWNKPSQSFSFLAMGEIFSLNQNLKNSRQTMAKLHSKFKKNYYHNLNKINFNKAPMFIGAQKFPLIEKSNLWNDFECCRWLIPKYLFLRNKNYYSIIINLIGDNKDIHNYLNDLDNELVNTEKEVRYNNENLNAVKINSEDSIEWNNIVNRCLEKITKKELEKVVPARVVELRLNSKIDFINVTDSLEENYPECYTFIYRNKNSAFFGTTPEKLFNVENGFIETDALAGSIQRGDSELDDQELGQQLLESEKDINEHNSVRNFLLEKLYHVTENIQYDCTPRLRKLSNIQHLWTPIKAKLKPDIDVLSLIDNLFPTPAICGYPTESALKLIESLENFDRGLYAGIIGWFNLENQGEFAVALRSAILRNNILHAFAGCGIVEGSDTLLEYNETELKLKPILSLFINETVSQP